MKRIKFISMPPFNLSFSIMVCCPAFQFISLTIFDSRPNLDLKYWALEALGSMLYDEGVAARILSMKPRLPSTLMDLLQDSKNKLWLRSVAAGAVGTILYHSAKSERQVGEGGLSVLLPGPRIPP